jgi:hypothetical protein
MNTNTNIFKDISSFFRTTRLEKDYDYRQLYLLLRRKYNVTDEEIKNYIRLTFSNNRIKCSKDEECNSMAGVGECKNNICISTEGRSCITNDQCDLDVGEICFQNKCILSENQYRIILMNYLYTLVPNLRYLGIPIFTPNGSCDLSNDLTYHKFTIIKGHMQSGKTLFMISIAFRYLLCGLSSLIVLRNSTSDLSQIKYGILSEWLKLFNIIYPEEVKVEEVDTTALGNLVENEDEMMIDNSGTEDIIDEMSDMIISKAPEVLEVPSPIKFIAVPKKKQRVSPRYKTQEYLRTKLIKDLKEKQKVDRMRIRKEKRTKELEEARIKMEEKQKREAEIKNQQNQIEKIWKRLFPGKEYTNIFVFSDDDSFTEASFNFDTPKIVIILGNPEQLNKVLKSNSSLEIQNEVKKQLENVILMVDESDAMLAQPEKVYNIDADIEEFRTRVLSIPGLPEIHTNEEKNRNRIDKQESVDNGDYFGNRSISTMLNNLIEGRLDNTEIIREQNLRINRLNILNSQANRVENLYRMNPGNALYRDRAKTLRDIYIREEQRPINNDPINLEEQEIMLVELKRMDNNQLLNRLRLDSMDRRKINNLFEKFQRNVQTTVLLNQIKTNVYSTFAVSATIMDNIFKEQVYADNIIMLDPPSNYVGVDQINFEYINSDSRTARDTSNMVEIITDIPDITEYIKYFNYKPTINLSKIGGETKIMPNITLLKISSYFKPMNEIYTYAKDFLETTPLPKSNLKTFNINNQYRINSTIYSGNNIIPILWTGSDVRRTVTDGMKVFINSRLLNVYNLDEEDFTLKTSTTSGTEYKFSSNFRVSQILDMIQENWRKNGKSNEIPNIMIITNVYANRGINFSTTKDRSNTWHLNEMFYIPSPSEKDPDLLQAVGRMAGIFTPRGPEAIPDGIDLFLYCTYTTSIRIRNAYKDQESYIREYKYTSDKETLLGLTLGLNLEPINYKYDVKLPLVIDEKKRLPPLPNIIRPPTERYLTKHYDIPVEEITITNIYNVNMNVPGSIEIKTFLDNLKDQWISLPFIENKISLPLGSPVNDITQMIQNETSNLQIGENNGIVYYKAIPDIIEEIPIDDNTIQTYFKSLPGYKDIWISIDELSEYIPLSPYHVYVATDRNKLNYGDETNKLIYGRTNTNKVYYKLQY